MPSIPENQRPSVKEINLNRLENPLVTVLLHKYEGTPVFPAESEILHEIFSRDDHFKIHPDFPDITPFHKSVLYLIANGNSNNDISRHTGISVNTVKKTIESLNTRLGTSYRTALVLEAMRHNIVQLPNVRELQKRAPTSNQKKNQAILIGRVKKLLDKGLVSPETITRVSLADPVPTNHIHNKILAWKRIQKKRDVNKHHRKR